MARTWFTWKHPHIRTLAIWARIALRFRLEPGYPDARMRLVKKRTQGMTDRVAKCIFHILNVTILYFNMGKIYEWV